MIFILFVFAATQTPTTNLRILCADGAPISENPTWDFYPSNPSMNPVRDIQNQSRYSQVEVL